MEVSRRRILQRHLEPARPLRRCIHGDSGKQSTPAGQTYRNIKGVGLTSIVFIFDMLMRILSFCLEPKINAATCAQALMEEEEQEVRNPKQDNVLGLQL